MSILSIIIEKDSSLIKMKSTFAIKANCFKTIRKVFSHFLVFQECKRVTGGGGGDFPGPFSKIRKKCPHFREKIP